MGDETIRAKTIGNPSGGMADDPWSAGHPAEGERVAIFAYDVTSVDGVSEDMRTYHVAPVDTAREGALTESSPQPQGVTVQWTGCGTGTVVRPTAALLGHEQLTDDPDRADAMVQCEVRPDDPRIIQA
ncbi:hypothetical protein BST13_09075 [Mycobacterium aquaticum]|uniref:Uncharacterized protein n=2 Tax=Mycobacterium aquaticum TaxID=1927124 RepID=A0A1X0B4L9_9MYCO|nr:hypothetical protein BST13_09075 [Mycobacterium aquaticum]